MSRLTAQATGTIGAGKVALNQELGCSAANAAHMETTGMESDSSSYAQTHWSRIKCIRIGPAHLCLNCMCEQVFVSIRGDILKGFLDPGSYVDHSYTEVRLCKFSSQRQPS
jgi:hypothetical protein